MGRRLIKVLSVEIEKIKSAELKKVTKQILLRCSDYNVEMGASSTGKYHPPFAAGPGGLIRHIKAVCRNTEALIQSMPYYDNEEWDVPYITAILHDCMKYTEYGQQFCHESHPNLMAALIREYHFDDDTLNKRLERIAENVACHMSRWNTCKHSDDVMPLPTSIENLIVSFADIIAAKKWFNATFDEENNITN
jgi:hypothetical protein